MSGILRKTFGQKRTEVVGEWTEFHDEELRDYFVLAKYYEDQKDEASGACIT